MAAHRNLSPRAAVQICFPQPAERQQYLKGAIFQETFAIATAITSASEVVAAAMGAAWTLMTSNVLLTAALGVAVIGMGFGFFRMAKNAMRSGI